MELTKFKLIEITEHVCSGMKQNQEVYDLEVADDHSYNIEGTIVHNSVCTTRKLTGVGYPQLSAIIECSDAAHGIGGHIISDGGCTCPGDVAKAFGANADFVMLGGMLAGCDEGGQITTGWTGKKTAQFYGMSSTTAMQQHSGGVAEYRASEGKVVEIPYRGKIEDVVKEILGGLRSACTYAGARSLKDLPKCTTFVRVTQTTNNVFGIS